MAWGAGAIDDAAVCYLLAVVLASLDHQWSHAFLYVGGGIAYVAFTLWLVRPLLARARPLLLHEGSLTEAGLVVLFALMALGAWFTDLIGLHAVFGAFVMGGAMPWGGLTRALTARLQPLTVARLLPLFFTYSGLNTKMTPCAGARAPRTRAAGACAIRI